MSYKAQDSPLQQRMTGFRSVGMPRLRNPALIVGAWASECLHGSLQPALHRGGSRARSFKPRAEGIWW